MKAFLPLLLAVCCLPTARVRADVALPSLFADHMVLQRDKAIAVWGQAAPGEKVVVSLDGEHERSAADNAGNWEVHLRPHDAGGPYVLTVQSQNAIKLKDVYLGEVWLAAGDTDMRFMPDQQLGVPNSERAQDCPLVREFAAEPRLAATLQPNVGGQWRSLSGGSYPPATTANFAVELNQKLKVAVGILRVQQADTQIGACRMPVRGILFFPGNGELRENSNYRAALSTMISSWRQAWGEPQLPFIVVQTTASGLTDFEPASSRLGELREMQSSVLQLPNCGLVTTVDLCRAWPQSQFDGKQVGHRLVLNALARVYGQPTDYSGPIFESLKIEGGVARLTFAGPENELKPYSAPVDAEPKYFPDVPATHGVYLAFKELQDAGAIEVLSNTRGVDNAPPLTRYEAAVTVAKLIHRGSIPKSWKGSRVVIHGEGFPLNPDISCLTKDGFYRIVSLLVIEFAADLHKYGVKTDDYIAPCNSEVCGFDIAGVDKKFYTAQAKIVNGEVVVSSEHVPAPVAVRYAWADYPYGANLCRVARNGELLPAGPFRTDDWP